MKLVHYSPCPLTLDMIKPRGQGGDTFRSDKPRGLWVSDNDDDTSWPVWCHGAGFRLKNLRWAYRVTLKPDAKILHIDDAEGLRRFDQIFGFYPPNWPPGLHSHFHIDWVKIAEWYDGILITPYLWSMRLDLMWYYSWDVASGCIWNPEAILSLDRIG